MSFFYDFFDEITSIDDTDNLKLTYVQNKGVVVVGKFKILTLNDELIILKIKKDKNEIKGENLMIKSISKGEIAVFGRVYNINCGEKNNE